MHIFLLSNLQVILAGKLGFSSQTLSHPEADSKSSPHIGKFYPVYFHLKFLVIKDDKQYQAW